MATVTNDCEIFRVASVVTIGRGDDLSLFINVVPAKGLEPSRLAAGDFKFLVDPSNINGLGGHPKHDLTVNRPRT
jgi:hypothetical protein